VLYAGVARSVTLLWKDHKRLDLESIILKHMKNLVYKGLEEFTLPSSVECIAVVPAPSSMKSTNKRGRVHLLPVSKCVVKALKTALRSAGRGNIKVHHAKLLRQKSLAKKQVTVAGVNRQSNKKGSITLSKVNAFLATRFFAPYNTMFVLVDDIVTSGSTIENCAVELEKLNLGSVPIAFTYATAIKLEE
jgi:predicted amidophosphoribosyltransferase